MEYYNYAISINYLYFAVCVNECKYNFNNIAYTTTDSLKEYSPLSKLFLKTTLLAIY